MRAFSSPASRDGFLVLGVAFLIMGAVVSTVLLVVGAVFLVIAVALYVTTSTRPFERSGRGR